MVSRIAFLILLTFVPALELRASIPYGILIDTTPLPWFMVFAICTSANIAVGIATFWAIRNIVPIITRIGFIGRLYARYVERTQRRIHRAVEKHGRWALAVFIGVPLPGSGAITGAVAAHLLGMRFRKFMHANVVGVLMAGVVVTAICLAGTETVEFARRMGLLKAPPAAQTQQLQQQHEEQQHQDQQQGDDEDDEDDEEQPLDAEQP